MTKQDQFKLLATYHRGLNIRRYLLWIMSESGLTNYRIAKLVPCSQSLLSKFKMRQKDVSLAMAQRIIDVCHKAVQDQVQ